MHMQIRGVVHGRNIELERETGLPDGADVTVQISAGEASQTDRLQRMRSLCGAWRDESLDAIFSELEAARSAKGGREVDFDRPS